MIRLSGLLADRPNPGSVKNARYYAIDNQIIYYSVGDSWQENWPLDQSDVVGTLSSTLLSRPSPASHLGWIFIDTNNGNEYEAFPDAWASITIGSSEGGGAVIGINDRQLFSTDNTLILDWRGTSISWATSPVATFGAGGGWARTNVIVGFEGASGLAIDALVNAFTDSLLNIDLINRRLYNPDGTTVAIDYGTNGAVILPNLPTSDPHVVGQLWKSGADMKISAGPP